MNPPVDRATFTVDDQNWTPRYAPYACDMTAFEHTGKAPDGTPNFAALLFRFDMNRPDSERVIQSGAQDQISLPWSNPNAFFSIEKGGRPFRFGAGDLIGWFKSTNGLLKVAETYAR